MAQTNYTDGMSATALAAASATFVLNGGLYGFTISGSLTNATLSRQAPDGTFVPTFAALTAAGYTTVYVPPGTYQVTGTYTVLNVAVTAIILT